MALAIQKTPYMQVLSTEQVMDGYAIQRRIEAAQQTKSILVRFYGLAHGTDIWIDGAEYVAAGSDMELFLSVHCELDDDVALVLDQSWEVMDVKGFAEELCWNTLDFNWQKYYTLHDLLGEFSEEVITACITSGIPIDELADKYQGHYPDETVFYREKFLEFNSDFPQEYLKYIDWALVAEYDGQSYHNHEGYIFDAC